MHIIQVITELEPAGAEKVLSDLSIELKKRDYTVSVLLIKKYPKNTVILEKLTYANIPVYTLGVSKFTFWKIFNIKKIIKEIIDSHQDNDVIVHSHLMHANLICRLGKILGQKYKLINTIHTMEKLKSKKWLISFDRLTLKYCDLYIAVSKSAQKFHSNLLKIDKIRIDVIENGISNPEKHEKNKLNQIKKELEISEFDKIIGSVGRLNYQKGYDLLLSSLSGISQIIPKDEKWAVVILGEGEERKKLNELILSAPSNLKIFLPGYRSDAASCIEIFDIFVMPSRIEGFPLVLLEAMSFGIPIISSLTEPIPDVLNGYPNYQCIDFNNSEAICNSLKEFILIEKNKTYMSPYTLEKMVNEYVIRYTIPKVP